MSITFESDAPCDTIEILEPCLCAQDAPHWASAAATTLAQHAASTCALCAGAGVWARRERTEPTLNVANVNAATLLALLRIHDDHTGHGSVPIPTMRRALIRTRSTFQRRAAQFTRGARQTHDGRCYEDGLSTERLERYLAALEKLCLFAQARGGRHIRWA